MKSKASVRRGVHEKVVEIFSNPEWKRGTVLDAGCGPGALTRELADLGYQMSGCDFRADDFAASDSEIEVRQADLNESLPYKDDAFDYVVSTEVLEHLQNPFRAIQEFSRVTRPGGTVVLTTPNYTNIEMRLRFLRTGSLSTPKLHRENIEAFRSGLAEGHIMPLTWWVLKLAIEGSGLEIKLIEKNKRKRKQAFLWPLVLLIRLLGRFRSGKKRSRWILDETNSGPFIMGGNVLIVVAKKR